MTAHNLVDAIKEVEDQIEESRGSPIYSLEFANLVCSQVWRRQRHHEGVGYITPQSKIVEIVDNSGLFELEKGRYSRLDKWITFSESFAANRYLKLPSRIASTALKAVRFTGKLNINNVLEEWSVMTRYTRRREYIPTGIFYINKGISSSSFDWTQFMVPMSAFYVQNCMGVTNSPSVTFALMISKHHFRKLKEELKGAFVYSLKGNAYTGLGQEDQFRANILGMRYLEMQLDAKIDLCNTKMSDLVERAQEEIDPLMGEAFKEDKYFQMLVKSRSYDESRKPDSQLKIAFYTLIAFPAAFVLGRYLDYRERQLNRYLHS